MQSTGARTIVISSHDPSSCDLLLAVAGFNANCTLSASGGGVDSNVDGSFTSVFTSTRSGSSGDAAVQIYGLLNPTDSAANITFDWGTGVLPNAAWAAVINVSGVNTASLALATNNTEQQVDNTGGTGLTFSPGGGTAGNISLVAVSVIGDDADGTFTNDEAETVLVEIDTGAEPEIMMTTLLILHIQHHHHLQL